VRNSASPRLLLLPILSVVEKRLQNQGCGNLVDDAPMLLAFVAGLVENLVGLVGGEPLVPKVDWQTGERTEFGREGLRLLRLGAGRTIELERVADDNRRHSVFARQPRHRTEIVARAALALEGQDWLCGQAKLVRDGNADAPVADVESEVARWG